MKYIVAGISFFFIWFAVALIVGFILLAIFPTKTPMTVGIGFDWRNLPGTFLGLLAGIHSARTSLKR